MPDDNRAVFMPRRLCFESGQSTYPVTWSVSSSSGYSYWFAGNSSVYGMPQVSWNSNRDRRPQQHACVFDSEYDEHPAAIFVGLYVPTHCGDVAGQKGCISCSRHLRAACVWHCVLFIYSCKSTSLPQTWHHAYCGFTFAENRGASRIGRISSSIQNFRT